MTAPDETLDAPTSPGAMWSARRYETVAERLAPLADRLPVPAASFDAVVSCLGVIFAGDRDAAAARMRGATAPGGVVSVLAWQPTSTDDPVLAPILAALGTPPPGAPSPIDWGVPEIARALMAADGGCPPPTVRPGEHDWTFRDVDEAFAFLATTVHLPGDTSRVNPRKEP